MELTAQERAFASVVEEHRRAAALTQAELGKQIILARSKVSELCSGRYLPQEATLDTLIDVLGMDRQRTVQLWRAALRARRRRLDGEKAARLSPPNDWEARPVLPAVVRSLLTAQQEEAQRFPQRLPHARHTTLEMVYVRQGLSTDTDQPQLTQSGLVPEWDERVGLFVPALPAMRLVVRPPARPLSEALDDHDHLLVSGGPGRGKSTMTLRLAADLVAAWTGSVSDGAPPLTEVVVPLRLTAVKLAAYLTASFPQALAATVSAEYPGLLHAEVGADVLAQRVEGCRWLLLVDGLDEVTDHDQRDSLVRVLARWAAESESPYRVVLTTRPMESTVLAPLRHSAHFELQPFDEDALQKFAVKWFEPEGVDQAQRFLRQIRQAHMDELVQVPLLATIAAIVFTHASGRGLPDNQYELYEEYLGILQAARATPYARFEYLRRALLEHLGDTRLRDANASLIAAAQEWVVQRTQPAERRLGWQDDLTQFLTAAGPLELRSNDLHFLHHSFAEHLAASANARTLPTEFDPGRPEFASLIHTARQDIRGRVARAVLLHYARQQHTSTADQLIAWLHDGAGEQQLLAAQLLASHLRASSQVIDNFLTTARAWAMTDHYMGCDVLGHISRATHHPGLVPWLAGLMHDDAAPWSSRIEAATALAGRLRAAYADEAAALLHRVIGDETIPVEHRLTAAEGLALCGAAERQAAERGLRTLLALPSAPAQSRRNAAVVLAGLDMRGRAHAIEFLTEALDDQQTLLADQVEFAAGLAEIDVNYHRLCAGVFRAVLSNPRLVMGDRAQAVIGLARLGPRYEAEAVDALMAIAGDRRLARWERSDAAIALAKIGPKHREIAAHAVLAMLNETGIAAHDRWSCASALVQLGSQFHEPALAHLRAVIADRTASTNAIMWAAKSLFDLGPEHTAEAAEGLNRVVADPLAQDFEHAYALSQLARLGEPYRQDAIRRLRSELADRDAEPAVRLQVAERLISLGPRFHREVTNALHEMASSSSGPALQVDVWCRLGDLGTRFQLHAARVFLAMLRSSSAADDTLIEAAEGLAALGPQYEQSATTFLVEVMTDPARSAETRSSAAVALIGIGPEYHRTAVDGLVMLLSQHPNSGTAPDVELPAINDLGAGLREELATAVRVMMSDQEAGPDQARWAADALIQLGFGNSQDVVAVLRAAATDELNDSFRRHEAAIELSNLGPECVPQAIAAVRDLVDADRSYPGQYWMATQLVSLGYDPVPPLRVSLANSDVAQDERVEAASSLARLDSALTEDAIAALRQFANDPFLALDARLALARKLGDLDPAARDDAIALHQAVLEDHDAPTYIRCRAAYGLIRQDRSRWQATTETLRRVATDPVAMPDHQLTAIRELESINALRPAETVTLALAVIGHPHASARDRAAASLFLPPRTQTEVWRSLLQEPTALVSSRLWPDDDVNHALRAEIAPALRDVFHAVESTRRERAQAASALAVLARDLVLEGVRALEAVAQDCGPTAFQAWRFLADLSITWRHHVFVRVERMVADESLPMRTRWRAAKLIVAIAPDPSIWPVVFLREFDADPRTTDVRRGDARFALRHVDGLGSLRALRDNPRAVPWARCKAAFLLTAYTADDRAAAARLLSGVATNPTYPPAMRCQACEDLAELGTPGRAQATEALRELIADDTLPTTARARAVRLLAVIRPSCAHALMPTLHELVNLAKPLHRLQALRAMAAINLSEAARLLRLTAVDQRSGPVIRLRAAEALAEMHGDHRETAAMVAREVMHDQSTAVHVRAHAARDLARWSRLCRQEARDFLDTLNSGPTVRLTQAQRLATSSPPISKRTPSA